MKRLLGTIEAGLLTLVVLSGCTPRASRLPEAPQQVIRTALSSAVTNFYLRDSLQKNVWNFNILFAQSLFLRTESNDLVGDLAQSLTMTSPLEATVLLRKNIFFHNGAPVTCDDIKWSYNDANHEGSPYRSTFEQIASIDCGDRGVKIRLKRQILGLLEKLLSGIRIYPAKAYPELSAKPVGSGPYKLVSINQEKSVWKKFSAYRGPLKPTNEVIEFYHVSDARLRYEWLRAGKLDLLLEWPAEMDPLLALKPPFLKIRSLPSNNVTVLGLSLKSKCFASLANRQALAEAVNEWKAQNLDLFLPTSLFLQPAFKSSANNLEFRCPKTEIADLASSNAAFLLAPLYKQLQQRFGIGHRPQESSVFFAKLGSGALEAFVGSVPSEEDLVSLYEYLHSSQWPPQKNRFYFQNPAVDLALENLITKGSKSPLRSIETLKQQVQEQIPFVPLGRIPAKLVYNDSVKLEKRLSNHPWLMLIEAVKKKP